MSKEAEKFIENYTTKDQSDWLVQKKDIIAKFMESYHKEQLILSGVSQQCELLELVTEIANSTQVYSNPIHKLWAKKLISSNCVQLESV